MWYHDSNNDTGTGKAMVVMRAVTVMREMKVAAVTAVVTMKTMITLLLIKIMGCDLWLLDSVTHMTKYLKAWSSVHAQICKPELSSLPRSGPAGSADAILNPYSSKRRSGGGGVPPCTVSHPLTPLSSHPIHRHPCRLATTTAASLIRVLRHPCSRVLTAPSLS